MRQIVLASMVLVLVLLAGCSQSSLINAMAPEGDRQAAVHYLDLLRQHRFDPIEQAIDPSIRPPDMHKVLVRMADEIPAQDPLSVKLVGFNQSSVNGVSSSNVTFEYQYPDRWLLANVAVKKADGVSTIIGLNVKPMSQSLETANRFVLAGKGAAQYVVLGMSVLMVAITLYALVLCARTHIARRKWLWIIFILVGICKLSINWNTGEWRFMPLSIQLFSASAFSAFYGPWILAVSFPLGAVWFFVRRKALLAASLPPALPPARNTPPDRVG